MVAKSKTPRSTFGVKAGSRKEEVAFSLQSKGPTYAIAKGLELDLKKSTLLSWIGQWRRQGHWKDQVVQKALKQRHKQRVAAKVKAQADPAVALKQTAAVLAAKTDKAASDKTEAKSA